VALCEIPHEEGCAKGISCYSWSLGLKFHTLEKANGTADCLENQFTPHELCNQNHERRWRLDRVQALLKATDNPSERIRPYKINTFFKIENGMQN
jgi:hypothetical protein